MNPHIRNSARDGVVVSDVRRMNEVVLRRARLVRGSMTVCRRYTISVCNQPAIVNSALHRAGVAKSRTILIWLRQMRECHLCRVAGNAV